MRLTDAHYPVSEIDVLERGADRVEIVAELVATAVVGGELDTVVADIAAMTGVIDAGWERSELD